MNVIGHHRGRPDPSSRRTRSAPPRSPRSHGVGASRPILTSAGTPADDVLLIVNGVIESVEKDAGPVGRFIAGSGHPRVFLHTWRARTDVKFARMPVAALETAGLPIDRIAPAVLEVLHRRDLLAGATAMFGSLDADAIADLEESADWIALKRGGVLVGQGEEGDRAFVLLSGRLQALRQADDGIDHGRRRHRGRRDGG